MVRPKRKVIIDQENLHNGAGRQNCKATGDQHQLKVFGKKKLFVKSIEIVGFDFSSIDISPLQVVTRTFDQSQNI